MDPISFWEIEISENPETPILQKIRNIMSINGDSSIWKEGGGAGRM